MTGETQNQKPTEPGKEERAQLKKLLEGHTAVLEHRLGRPPTMQEMVEFLKEGEQGQQPAPAPQQQQAPQQLAQSLPAPATNDEAVNQDMAANPEMLESKASGESHGAEPELQSTDPRILNYKVYYGVNGEGDARQPDPKKILFYHDPERGWYDTLLQEWLSNEPSYASHLNCREINHNENDMVAAIAHGVMDDQDYEQLDKAGMIGELPKQLWSKIKRLRDLYERMEKSDVDEGDTEEAELEPGSETEEISEDSHEDETGPLPDQEDVGASEGDLAGDNVLEQIMAAAFEAASSDLEMKVTDIVRKIMSRYGFSEESGENDELTDYEDGDSIETPES